MNHLERSSRITTAAAILATVLGIATTVHADAIKALFVIAMENHNWTQPANDGTAPSDLQRSRRAVHQQPDESPVAQQ